MRTMRKRPIHNVILAAAVLVLSVVTLFLLMAVRRSEQSEPEPTEAPEVSDPFITPAPADSDEAAEDSGFVVSAGNTVYEVDAHESEEEEEADPTKEGYVYWDVPLANSVQEYIQDLCKHYEFDYPEVVISLIQTESNYEVAAVSETSDIGFMQINPDNFEWLHDTLGINSLYDWRDNILCGIYMLSDLYKQFGDMNLALIGYNRGPSYALACRWSGISENKYSASVMNGAKELVKRVT